MPSPSPKTHRDSPEWRLSELRSLLHRPPCPLVWAEICAVLAPAAHDDYLWEMLIPYAEEHLKAWPDAMRVNPAAWMRATLRGERCRLWRLARHLHHRGPLGDHGLLVVLSNPDMGPLTHVMLSECDLGEEAGAILGRHLSWSVLESLTLDHNPLGGRGVWAMLPADATKLARISLRRCGLSTVYAVHINKAGAMSHIKHLNISDNDLSIHAMLTDRMESIETLNISGNRVRLEWLSAAPKQLPTLREVRLTGLEVRERSVRAALEHLYAQRPELAVWVDDERWEP